jgi:hypothetical protein
MLGRVQLLPLQPQVVLQARAGEHPLQAGFVRALESQRLALQWRQQSVWTRAIRSGRIADTRRRQRAEHER